MRRHYSPGQVNLFVLIALGCLVVISVPVSMRLAAKWAAAGYVSGWVGNILAFALVVLINVGGFVLSVFVFGGLVIGYEWIRDRIWRRRP